MAQLIMNWQNDGTPVKEITLPEGVEVINFPNLKNALSIWADIIPYLNADGNMEKPEEYYQHSMAENPNYNDNNCFFLLVNNCPAATLTVICDYKKKQGYIHNVACKPEFRGKGYGKALLKKLAQIAVERGCGRLEWWCLNWNKPSIDFYLSLGAEPMKDWTVYRIAGNTLTQLAE